MCVDHQRLNLPDRDIEFVLLDHHLDDVDGGKGGVEGEVKPFLVPCLAVPKSGKLVPVAVAELDLEAGAVDVEHVDALHRRVGGEIQPVRPVLEDVDDQPDVPLQRLAAGDQLIGLLALDADFHLGHPAQIKVVEVDFPVIDPSPAALAGRGAFVEVVEHRVVAQPADQLEAYAQQGVDERPDREGRVGHQRVGDLEQPVPVPVEHRDVPLVQRHLQGLELAAVEGLDCPQHHAVLDVGINQADAQDLQPVLDGRGTARPEAPHMGSLPARLGNVARVDGDGQTAAAILETVRCQVHVILQPVELPPEGLAVALLAAPSVAPELQEIDLSGYGHD